MGRRQSAWKRGLPVALLLLCGCGGYRPDAGSVRQQMVAMSPLNTGPKQVMASLDARKIVHSPYKHDPSSGNSIEASVPVAAPHALVEPSYLVVFKFNDRDELTGYDVQYLGYVGF